MLLEELKIDRRNQDPVSTQIVKFVRSQIRNRKLDPGQRLPATTEIIKKLGIGNHTLSAALAQLEQEGFIRVIPGRGTFVAKNAFPQQSQDGEKRQKMTRVALSSPFVDFGQPDIRYRINSVQGFLEECARLNINGTILTEQTIKSESAESLLQHLLELDCEGLVWLYPGLEDRAKIRYLQDAGYPVVVTRRSHLNDQVASVEGDEFKAGLLVAGHLADTGCKELVVFQYYDETDRDRKAKESFPIGFSDGLKTLFERRSGLRVDNIKFLYTKENSKGSTAFIKKHLMQLNGDAGVIFTSGLDFFRFIMESSPEDSELLKTREVVVGCTRFWVLKFAPLVKDLNFKVFITPFSEISRCAVQKLANLVEGNLENTITYVNIEFADFWEFWKSEATKDVNDLMKDKF